MFRNHDASHGLLGHTQPKVPVFPFNRFPFQSAEQTNLFVQFGDHDLEGQRRMHINSQLQQVNTFDRVIGLIFPEILEVGAK